jgi:serine protease Do
MLMNKRNLWMSLGVAALGIILAALPGSSARTQDPDQKARVKVHVQKCAGEDCTQVVSKNLDDQEELSSNLQNLSELEEPEEHDVQVFMGDSGGWLGVETREVTAENVKELKLPAERGALVGKIIPDSPAAKAGLKDKDVITEVNGQRVEGTAQFRRMIREIPAGRAAQLTVLRDGKAQSLAVTLGKLESHDIPEIMRSTAPGAFAFRIPEVPEVGDLDELRTLGVLGLGQPRLGIDAEDLRGELGNYFGAPDGEGILVRRVFDDSPAAKAGLKSGDVVTSVNGKRVRSVRELREQLTGNKEESKSVKLGLLRNKAELSLSVEMPARTKREIHQRSERSNL